MAAWTLGTIVSGDDTSGFIVKLQEPQPVWYDAAKILHPTESGAGALLLEGGACLVTVM